MKDETKIVLLVALGLGALYVLMRERQQQLAAGGTVGSVPVSPTSPSFTGANIGAGTNPLSALISGISGIFSTLTAKGAGNAPAQGSTPATQGTLSMPWTLGQGTTGAGYIPPPPMNPNASASGAVPQLGDPNFGAWDYLGAGAPSMTWTLPPGFDAIPEPVGMAGGGVPDMSWTLDPVALGFDPNAIPSPSGGASYPDNYPRISVTGLEY